jgi:hypothetical protein
MVKAEGWLAKPGSKWKTMPELMFRYRAAAFFGRLYAPDILMGMPTSDEMLDISHEVVEAKDKVAERVEHLIKDARNLKDLENIQNEVGPGQMDLFQERMRDLS